MTKILNFGSLNIDYTYNVPHFVREGETLSSGSLNIYPGGKGLNQSVALSRSGARVWHAGAVGDGDGDFLVDILREAGVHTEWIYHTERKTGHAIIQRDAGGGNCILLYGGANQEITIEMADRALQAFEKDDFLVLQNEISCIGYIMEKAREKGMKLVLNPSPMNEKVLSYPLEYTDYFLLNEVEAEDICGEAGEGRRLLGKMADRFPGARIVLTLGSKGSLYWNGREVIEQCIYPVKTVDTTAAGDTFTGYFIGGLVQGMEERAALELAARAASIAVSRPGASVSIPLREEVDPARAGANYCLTSPYGNAIIPKTTK